jgi:hypothetical protein
MTLINNCCCTTQNITDEQNAAYEQNADEIVFMVKYGPFDDEKI